MPGFTLDNLTWDNYIKNYLHNLAQVEGKNKGVSQAAIKIIKETFVKRKISKFVITTKNQDKVNIATVYYTVNELYIQNDKEGWNIVSSGNKIYEWKVGHKTGLIIEANEKDLIDYIIYLTDPAGFKISIYKKYLKDQKRFIVEPRQNSKLLKLRKPTYGIQSVEISENPFWLLSIKGLDPYFEISVTLPEEVQEVAPDIKKIPDFVEFKESDNTLRMHLEYL